MSPARLAEAVRFGLVGASSCGVYLGVLSVLSGEAGILAASVAAYGAAIAWSYLLQRNWTFRSGVRHRVALPRFVATHLAGMAINAAILYGLVTRGGYGLLLAQGAAIATLTVWGYVAQRLWVFAGMKGAE